MVRYFEKSLKSSTKAEMYQDAIHLDDYEELIVKAIRVETKTRLWPSFYVQEIDQQVFWEIWLAYTIAHKVQTQKAMKNHCGNKLKVKAFIPISTLDFEPSNKARKNKKKKKHKDKWDSINLATGVNKVEVNDYRKKKQGISEITYYNYNKKGYYIKKCSELWKLKN